MPTSSATFSTGLDAVDYAMVAVYLLATLGIVVWASRRQRNTEDFFLGGRRLPWLAVGLSIMATLMSSLTYIGLTGEVVKNGIAAFLMQLAVLPAALVIVPVFIPFFMRLRLTSAYEYLEHRFDYRARLLGGGLFFLLRFGWVSLVMYAGSLALSEMTSGNLMVVIVLLGVAATLYGCFGGLTAVVWTDVLQGLMLFAGAAAIVLYVWWDTGAGPLAWWQAAGEHSAAHTRPALFSFDPTVRLTLGTALMSGFFWQLCTHCSDQVVLQRYASTPTLAAARNSFLTNAASVLAITTLLLFSGLALLYYYVRHPESLPAGAKPTDVGDKLMLHFFAGTLPLGFGGLMLANFLCDAMQTLVSGVQGVTVVASQDIWERRRSERTTAADGLWTARWLSLAVGGAATLAAVGVAWLVQTSNKNIIDMMPRTFNLFLGPLGALFLIGMFVPRARARTALLAVLTAIVFSVCWSYWRELFGTDYDLSIAWAIPAPCIVAFLLAAVGAQLMDPPGDHPGRQYTWTAVMRRPLPTVPPTQSLVAD